LSPFYTRIMLKIGILREGKTPPDMRVALSPAQCRQLISENQDLQIVVQPSPNRCFKDEEYLQAGIALSEDLNDCDLLIGIKEVPVAQLIPNKKHLFFSHTIKKQAHNKKLMRAVINKHIQLIDYECLTDKDFNRIIGFGHYAGIVGAYNGIMAYGLRYGLFNLKPAHLCHDRKELVEELKKARLTNIKMIVTGNGRVANGAIELLGMLGIRRVTPYEFVSFSFREPTYVQLHSSDYNEAIDGKAWNRQDFYAHPEHYRSTFAKFTEHCDLLLHCSFWDPQAPRLFTPEEMTSPRWHISVIADITCDIDGSIPSTIRASDIENKFYGFNPQIQQEDEPFKKEVVTVMAVDNLPCELPRDASEDFGKELIDKVFPSLLDNDKNGLIERATIAQNGRLMPRFAYLGDYALND
jgi:saccharopine dehydrogenase (NAD+, L-lysine forming)